LLLLLLLLLLLWVWWRRRRLWWFLCGRFADHMQKKTEAVSEFARSKTLQEQREYLPIYTVREELMKVR
jgi:hypothetical protein